MFLSRLRGGFFWFLDSQDLVGFDRDHATAEVEEHFKRASEQRVRYIAITDHHNKDWAFKFRELVESHYPGEVIIIPGWEIEIRPPQSPFDEYQVAELFLPGGGVFRTYCHPGYYSPNILIEDGVHAIEIDNYIHNWHIRKDQVQEIADSHGLLTLEVSDAHNLENIGLRYSEVELDELYRRASPES